MSPARKSNAKKWACSLFLAAMALAGAVAVGQAQDKESPGASTRYRVVRMPANIVDTEFNTEGKARKPSMRPIHPLDELAAEGWELVTVVRVDGARVHVQGTQADAEGGDFICFLRRRR
jgi:hypothetical protein